MRPVQIDIDPADVDADGIADGNASTGATVTLDGALTSGGSFTSADGLAHRISIQDKGNDNQAGATYTITGTDADGNAQTEDITGPAGNATVTSVAYWLTITIIAIASPAAGSSVDIGTVDEIQTPTTCLNYRCHYGATVAIQGASGTAVSDIEETFGDLAANTPENVNWWTLHADKNCTDAVFTMTRYARGVRVNIDSYTNSCEYQLHILQT